MIESLMQAIQMQAAESVAIGEQLVCDARYSKVEGADGSPCAFAIFDVGPGQAFLVCVAHGQRLLATEKAVGTSHEGSFQRKLADAIKSEAEGANASKRNETHLDRTDS